MRFLLLLVAGLTCATGQVTLSVPAAGNCGDETLLTCRYTASTCLIWLFKRGNIEIVNIANPTSDKYEGIEDTGQKTITLTIKNMEMSDGGNYRCYCGFNDFDEKELNFECKPTAVTKRIRPDKRLEVIFNQVYPNPSSLSVTVNSSPQLGTHTCTGSTSTSYSCTWTSSSSLEDVDGGYRVVVATVTQTALTGNIKIVTPGPPSITSPEQLPDGRWVIRATEDSQVTLECVSSGGIPTPTVAWYRDSISTSPLSSISTEVQQGDGTYRVTLTHTITASRSEDLKTFVCRSHYPQATSTVTQGSQETPFMLYLNLKPSVPTVSQTYTPVSGGTVVLDCKTSGSRPLPNVTWTYKTQTYTPNIQTSLDPVTKTYNSLSTFRRLVTAADNGQQITCHVTHLTLTSTLDSSINIAVKYVTVMTTNTTTLSHNATVTCILNNFGNSYESQPWVQEWPEYGEVRRRPFSPLLTLIQLTYEYSGTYTCKVKTRDSGDIYAVGNTFLSVKSPPVILNPKHICNRYTVFVGLYHNVTISVEYFSNVPGSDVKCYRSINGIRSTNPLGNIVHSEVTVQLPVFSHTVPTPGTMASVTLIVQSETDFGDYDIVITNGIGEGSHLPLTLKPTRPPDKPTHILIVTNVPDRPLLLWEPGFDGGSEQTFVIQTSEDGVNWINNTIVDAEMSKNYLSSYLKNIQSSTLLFVRMFSYNTIGRSIPSDVLNFTSKSGALEDTGAYVSKGLLIGGVVGSLLVGILLGLVIFFLFARYKTCCYLKSGLQDNLSVKLHKREAVEIRTGEDVHEVSEPGVLIADIQAIGLSPVTYEHLSRQPGEDKQQYESLDTKENPEKVYYNIQD